MFKSIFNPNNDFFRFLSQIVDFVGLSIIWSILVSPVVTAGAATSALYYTVKKVYFEKEESCFKTFFRAFVINMNQGTKLTLAYAVIFVVLGYGYYVMYTCSITAIGAAMFYAYSIALTIPMCFVLISLFMIGRSQITTKDLIRSSLILSFRHYFVALVCVIPLVLFFEVALQLYWPFLCIPTLWMIVCVFLFERIFNKYQ